MTYIGKVVRISKINVSNKEEKKLNLFRDDSKKFCQHIHINICWHKKKNSKKCKIWKGRFPCKYDYDGDDDDQNNDDDHV